LLRKSRPSLGLLDCFRDAFGAVAGIEWGCLKQRVDRVFSLGDYDRWIMILGAWWFPTSVRGRLRGESAFGYVRCDQDVLRFST